MISSNRGKIRSGGGFACAFASIAFIIKRELRFVFGILKIFAQLITSFDTAFRISLVAFKVFRSSWDRLFLVSTCLLDPRGSSKSQNVLLQLMVSSASFTHWQPSWRAHRRNRLRFRLPTFAIGSRGSEEASADIL